MDRTIVYELRDAANSISKIVGRLRYASTIYEQKGTLESLGDIHNIIRKARTCLDLASEKADTQTVRLIEEIIALPAPEAICGNPNSPDKRKNYVKH